MWCNYIDKREHGGYKMNPCGPGISQGAREVKSSEMRTVPRMMTPQLAIHYITGAVLVVKLICNGIQSIIMLSFCLLNIPSSYRSFCSTLMIENINHIVWYLLETYVHEMESVFERIYFIIIDPVSWSWRCWFIK